MAQEKQQSGLNAAENTRRIAAMFDRIAPTYDLLNSILSVGQHFRWARKLMRIADPANGEIWLDIATGSGPLMVEGLRRRPGSFWIGLDPSRELLRLARKRTRLRNSPLLLGVGERLPLADRSVQGITIAYGLRNFANPTTGLGEMARVLIPGGKVFILEFHPVQREGGWGRKGLVQWYLENVLPRIGRSVSGDAAAYRYLAETAGTFWTLERLNGELVSAGLEIIRQVSWMWASVTLTVARRPL
jgi:demethylmenaquinone methyltransferase/2-methoxy-6-polyprenyl-1,4-benzoquinol methylase